MPELPEVETVKNQLWHALQDKKIKSVTLNRQNLRFPLPENFTPLLTGAVCQTISRHGKYILMGLDNNMTLLIHLGMTGRFVMGDTYMQLPDFYHHYALNPIHEHIIFITECNMRVGYYDPRRFGYMDAAARIKSERSKVRDEDRKQSVIANASAAAAQAGIPIPIIAAIWEILVEGSIAYEMAAWENMRA